MRKMKIPKELSGYNKNLGEFVKDYGIDMSVIRKRVASYRWRLFDALVTPTTTDLTPDKLKRVIACLDMGWSVRETAERVDVEEKEIENVIATFTPAQMQVYRNMTGYFYLSANEVDLEAIFPRKKGV